MTSAPANPLILVIDDNVEICDVIARYLGREGFEVESVHNGETGIEIAVSGAHALVILDIVLPGINGFEVLRRIREQSSVPVILMSGTHRQESDRTVALSGGADDYLSKPFSMSALLARIHAILRRIPDGE